MKRTKVVSVTSGKGGVGKSTVVANLALALGRSGLQTLVLDGDLGMANLDIMFGVKTMRNMSDVVKGDAEIKDILVGVAHNVTLIPGGSGIFELTQMDFLQKQYLMEQIGCLEKRYDYLLIDTAPGIDTNVLTLNSYADEIVVVTTPDPSSLTDAYALIKVLHKKMNEKRFSIVANLVSGEEEGLALFRRLSDVSAKFLSVSLDYKGCIPLDPKLRQATKLQQLIVRKDPMSESAIALDQLADSIGKKSEALELKGGLQVFWSGLAGVA